MAGDVYTNYSCHTSVLNTGILFTWQQSAVSAHEGRVTKKRNKHQEAKHIASGKVLPAAKKTTCVSQEHYSLTQQTRSNRILTENKTVQVPQHCYTHINNFDFD